MVFVFLCLNGLSACIHTNQKIHNLKIKSSKAKILKILSKPMKIRRKEGKDYWFYKFDIDDQAYTRVLVFKKGKLYSKGKLEAL